MLSRVAACWLVVLVLAPFTAPFPTCDLMTLVGGAQTRHSPGHLPVSAVASDSSIASVPAIAGVGRIRFSVVSSASSGPAAVVSAATALTRPAAPVACIHDHAGLATILRV